MNSAGLPGTGLGGLFYVLLALFMPVSELVATARGRSNADRWRFVLAQFAMACGIVGAVVATVLALGAAPAVVPGRGLEPLPPALALAGPAVLLLVVVGVRVWALLESGHRADAQHAEGAADGHDRGEQVERSVAGAQAQ